MNKKRILSLWMIILLLVSSFQITGYGKQNPVQLKNKKLVLTQGSSKKIKIKKQAGVKIKKIKFKASSSIITVNKKGKVTAKAPGKAKVTLTVHYRYKKKNYKKKLICKVTVKAKASTTEVSAGTSETVSPSATEPETTLPATTAAETVTTTVAEAVTTTSCQAETTSLSSDASEETQPSTQEEQTTSLTSSDLIKELALGINLGNTLDAYCANAGSVEALEQNWGQPLTTKGMIQGMKEAGFHTLRIPVAWSSMLSDSQNYTINPALFSRVKELVDYARECDMYVIINIHWDGQWWGMFGDSDSQVVENAWSRYQSYWTQIATYFKDYDDHLIFESANEELGDRLNDNWQDTSSYVKTGILTEDQCYSTTNAINQKFVDIVRGCGGNNASRYLLIAGYNTDIYKTCDDRFSMPTDSISDHLLLSVHYYSPYGYALVTDSSDSFYDGDWGTSEDISSMTQDLALLKTTFVSKGIPVIIGEYSVCAKGNQEANYVIKDGRDLYFRTLCQYCISNGICPILWDTGHVYSKSSCKIWTESTANLFHDLALSVAQN